MIRALTHVLWSIGDAIAENGLIFIWGVLLIGMGVVSVLLNH